MGPAIVTKEEVGDPHQLNLKTWVNGELTQNSRTNDLIFNCFEIIEFISTAITLQPGTVIPNRHPEWSCGRNGNSCVALARGYR